MRYCFKIEINLNPMADADSNVLTLLAHVVKGQRAVAMTGNNRWQIADDPGRAAIFAFSLVSIGLSFHHWREDSHAS